MKAWYSRAVLLLGNGSILYCTLGLILISLVMIGAGCRRSTDRANLSVLRTVRQVLSLSPDDAELGHPVLVRGVITYYFADSNTLIIQDSTGGILIQKPQTGAALKMGDEVEVQGSSGRGEPFNLVISSALRVLDAGELPNPEKLTLRDLASGAECYRWVEAEGIVRSATLDNDAQLTLDVAVDGGRVQARIAEHSGLDFDSFVYSRVRIRGVARSVFNARGEAIRFQLMVASLDSVVVEERSAENPFSIVAQSIGAFLRVAASEYSGHRVRVHGVVARQEQGSELVIRDETGELLVNTSQMTSVQPGSQVDVLGFPSAMSGNVFFEDATFRQMDAGSTGNVSTSPVAAGSLALLTTVDQIHKLSPEEAKRNYPVRLRCVVTYYEPLWHFAFIQDSTAGIFMDLRGERGIRLEPGQLVEVEGQSGPGDFAPVLIRPRLRVVGKAPMPIAGRLSLENLFSGVQDSNWVEAEGIVQTVKNDAEHALLGIVSGSRKFKALVPGFATGKLPTHLVDSRVRIRGACGTLFNGKRQLIGIQIFVPGIDYVTVEEPAPVNSFDIPVRPINTLLRFTPGESVGHRVRSSRCCHAFALIGFGLHQGWNQRAARKHGTSTRRWLRGSGGYDRIRRGRRLLTRPGRCPVSEDCLGTAADSDLNNRRGSAERQLSLTTRQHRSTLAGAPRGINRAGPDAPVRKLYFQRIYGRRTWQRGACFAAQRQPVAIDRGVSRRGGSVPGEQFRSYLYSVFSFASALTVRRCRRHKCALVDSQTCPGILAAMTVFILGS